MKNKLVCIVCPIGCEMDVVKEGEDVLVSGNKCKRGKTFAENELKNPKRSICSTVKTVFDEVPVLPVRLSNEIPKDRIFDVMAEINKALLTRRIGAGDVVIPDVLGLSVDVIASSNILLEN